MTEAERQERNILALTIWGEARGEAVEGRIAVACVIHNRIDDGRWPSSYAAVCQQPKQFSCWNAGDPNRPHLNVLLDQLTKLMPSEPVLSECLWISDGMITGKILPRVKHATHYHTRAILPNWANGADVVATIGSHIFYQGVK